MIVLGHFINERDVVAVHPEMHPSKASETYFSLEVIFRHGGAVILTCSQEDQAREAIKVIDGAVMEANA